ncbi:MAG TPA: ATP-dependent DNA ligase, partial [Solirubrobacteraceae bacterium]
ERKWHGFRTIAFVDGDSIYLQSRNGRPMTRYFPEIEFPAGEYVVDGEIVVFGADGGEDFDALGQRIHPAESRIRRLAGETPARFIAFDLLAREGEALLERPFLERRETLAELAEVEHAPWTVDPAEADPWLQGAEGVIAKELAAPYRPGERVGMVKVKRVRTIDAVVMGWRPGKAEGTLGSLILGLYDGERLCVVGHSSGFSAKEKRELVTTLAPYETGERGRGDPSRWKSDKELEWVLLRPELVVEINFDHVSGRRIRHGAKVQRWRDDKPASACTIDQLGS